MSQPDATPPDRPPPEDDISESQLMHCLGAVPESSHEFPFMLRPPSPVATADLSDSDLKEVFGETEREPQSEDGPFAVSASSTGNSGGVVGDRGRVCSEPSSLPGCPTAGQSQSGWLHVSGEKETMALLQARSAEHLQGIVNELQAALGGWLSPSSCQHTPPLFTPSPSSCQHPPLFTPSPSSCQHAPPLFTHSLTHCQHTPSLYTHPPPFPHSHTRPPFPHSHSLIGLHRLTPARHPDGVPNPGGGAGQHSRGDRASGGASFLPPAVAPPHQGLQVSRSSQGGLGAGSLLGGPR